MRSINPHNDQLIREYPKDSGAEIETKLQQAQEAFSAWRRFTFENRGMMLKKLASLLEAHMDEYATLIATEMGKAFVEAIAEIQKCAKLCHFYAQHAAQYLANEIIETEASKSYVSYQPLGILLGVMPWNFPFWQVFRFLVPSLMAGNVVLVKHAANVQGCARMIQDLTLKAGIPEGCYTNLGVSSDKVADLIADKRISAVTLTGSTQAGQAVASCAGQHIKKTVLELGGSDPYLVLADADIEAAVNACVTSRLINNGQSCIAAKRFIIDKNIYDKFVNQLKSRATAFVTGNPMDKKTQLGPMATKALRDELHGQVTASVNAGANLLLGGEIPQGPGAYYPVTILGDVTSEMPAYEEELFGPVFTLIRCESEQEAIAIANQSDFGLGAAVFSQNINRAEEIAQQELAAGSVAVNDFIRSDARLPFGGIKMSGYGRELSGHGIREFTNIKSILIK